MANNNWIRRSEAQAIPTGYLRNQKAQQMKRAIAQLPWRCGPCLQVLQLWLHIRNVRTRWAVITFYSLKLGTNQIARDFTFRIHNGRRAQWKSKKPLWEYRTEINCWNGSMKVLFENRCRLPRKFRIRHRHFQTSFQNQLTSPTKSCKTKGWFAFGLELLRNLPYIWYSFTLHLVQKPPLWRRKLHPKLLMAGT